ncbi:MAG: hypothetical protein A2X61_15185 [Ignavibacteria bacterium GWB2_35_12]|nr:MAG: hypothetical protein A2X63_03085 [Ignavibacteria bacterium GWA2_35_8]OGU41808.1 MAG: hypothetical protein A2X61_15185 [Ignavibacteria bacterium GWB2_35_12]OGU92590.1 MAG: hypothetical protein A2220_02410 [Ignavibacteria bacterium RIFOXYA2_FULL_35_10]OGV24332.1 MAG: hypothetical protein A2475_05170 [Ignavibacteria bacterium RIFOXYC2_FULL_35_21]
MENEKLKELIKYRIERSKETLKDAEVAIENDRINNALNRIYYSAFYIVSALALKHNFSTSKHKQLLGWFNREFISTGKIESGLYKIYSKSFDTRQESDYEDFIEYEKSEAEQHFSDMLQFVSEIEKIILQD